MSDNNQNCQSFEDLVKIIDNLPPLSKEETKKQSKLFLKRMKERPQYTGDGMSQKWLNRSYDI